MCEDVSLLWVGLAVVVWVGVAIYGVGRWW